VAKDYLSFCAGHFISLESSPCQRLHGHNYRVAVEVEAALTKDGLLCDFALLKTIVKQITDELDHRMLLPAASEDISVETQDRSVRVRMRDREWTFPKEDCVFLPLSTTTAELIANWMAGRVDAELRKQAGVRPSLIRLEIEESPGQSAFYEIVPDP
jgi:6-pyruvoyltetrahydropterin/6-carboxytetrahydropterin synthase